MTTKINHLEQLCVFQVDFDIWSGQTRLSPDDFKIGTGGEIPPEKVAQLGTKKICDPAKLKGFHRLKSDTRRTLLRYGMPFMNGYAIPLSRCSEIIQKLDEVEAEFKGLKAEFINGYNQAIDEWCGENPEYEGALRAGALPLETVEKRIGFEYQVIQIGPVDVKNTGVSERLARKVNGLGDELIADLVEEADKFYSERLAGRDKCGITTRMTLRNMRDKLDGLSFLNSKIQPLVKLLDETIAGYAQYAVGREVHAPFFHQVVATALILSSKSAIERYLEGAITVQGYAADLQRDPDTGALPAGSVEAAPATAPAPAPAIAGQQELQAQASLTAEAPAAEDVQEDAQAAPQQQTTPMDFAAEMDALLGEISSTTPVQTAPVEVLDAPVSQEHQQAPQPPAAAVTVINVEARVVEKDPDFSGFDDIQGLGEGEGDSYF